MEILCIKSSIPVDKNSRWYDDRIVCVCEGSRYNLTGIQNREGFGIAYILLETGDTFHDAKLFVIPPPEIEEQIIENQLVNK